MADTWTKVRNKFFKKKPIRLAMVQFQPGQDEYTYGFHIKQGIKKGDFVVVPTGGPENVLSKHNSNPIDFMSIGRVTDITDDKKHIPKKHKLRFIIAMVNFTLYVQLTKKHEDYMDDAIEL